MPKSSVSRRAAGAQTRARAEGARAKKVAAPRTKATATPRAGVAATPRTNATKPAATAARAKPAVGLDARAALRHLRASDPVLARLIDDVGPLGMETKETGSVFGALAEAIVYQQLTGKAAGTIYGRVCALFPKTKNGFAPKHILGATDEALRGAGLSRAKVAALRDLAARTDSGELPTLAKVRRMDDDAIVEALTQVRGIGRWTVEMLLMFRLGRTDVLPVDDYGVRKGYAIAFRKKDLPTTKDLARYGEKWKPWRSVASWYLWRATDRKPETAKSKSAAAKRKPGAGKTKPNGAKRKLDGTKPQPKAVKSAKAR
jgi:3-methyladenine DNA glycosylase/8-oxoguanine DNA glycosylase